MGPLCALHAAFLALCAPPEIGTSAAPGYSAPVCGVWYGPGEAGSAMPLGALGTGFVELTGNAVFGASTVENNWLTPRPVAEGSGFVLRIGETTAELLPKSPPLDGLRFWGHFPAADVTFGDRFAPVDLELRAFAPLVPHDYTLSEMPVALFRFRAVNRGQEAVPAEIAFTWETPPEAGAGPVQGNVEGALGWRRARLDPGNVWTVRPTILLAPSREELVRADIDAAREALAGEPVPEGSAYTSGQIRDFYLDAFGGFSWEHHKRQSATYEGAPHVSQVMWEVRWESNRAGRGPNHGWGFSGTGLPARTEDGRIEVRLAVESSGETGIACRFEIENTSDKALENVQFGYAVNMDLGGMAEYQTNQAAFDRDLGAIVFESDSGMAGALSGAPDAFYVGLWPAAHEALFANQLLWVGRPVAEVAVESIPNGILWRGNAGSYAVGVRGDGWQPACSSSDDTLLRARAAKELQPGEASDVVFALAWHFPEWSSSDGEPVRHRYAATCPDAGQVLEKALPEAEAIEAAIVAWQEQVYDSKAPPALKDAAINGLYVLARNSWWLDDGRFFQSESFTGCPITETLVCRFNGSTPLALLWPECERATMAEFIRTQAASGQIAFGFGSPMGTRTPMWNLQQPIVSTEFVLLAWRNYHLWGEDPEYLKEVYPAMKKALQFALTLDKDGDGLVNEAPGSETGFPANQYYDVWPWWGTSAYTGSITLAALKAGESAAARMGDEGFMEELRETRSRATEAFDRLLWTGDYYRLYNDPANERRSDTSLTNALCGQWFAYTCGLGQLVREDRVHRTIDTVLRLNAAATPFGAVNGVRSDGTVDDSFAAHSSVITIGEVWNFCAMAAFAGRVDEALDLFEKSYENIALRQRSPWNIPWSYDRATGAISWGIHYYSNPCVWTLLGAVDPEVQRRLGKPTGNVSR